METNGVINENYKPLITLSSDSPDFSMIQDDVSITPQVNCAVISTTTNPVIPNLISDPTIATPNIGSFVTPCTLQPFHSNSSFSSPLDSLEAKLCEKIMAMKSFFMDELQTIKNKSLKSAKIRNTSTNIDHGTVDKLRTKIKLLENENKLLKDDIKNKQKLAQNAFAQKHSVTRKINDKSISDTNTKALYKMIKRMSQTSQKMTDLKNYKLVLKIFILRLINRE